jgi:hypothetical protein
MGILENIEPPKRFIPSCHIRTIMADLDETDRTILNGWLADTATWSGAAIAQALNSQGIEVSRTSVNIHRKGGCSCLRV